jgi:steroid delta-isomerase-like uncharacterized protein
MEDTVNHTLRTWTVGSVGILLLGLLAVFGCQPQSATPEGGVTMAEAVKICSTYNAARNTNNLDLLDQIMAEDVLTYDVFSFEPMTSLEQLKLFYLGMHSAFSEIYMEDDEIMVSGNKVICVWTMTATQTGTFGYLPPSGKDITAHGVAVYDVEDGKVVKLRSYFDRLAPYEEMGFKLVMPEEG